MRPWIRISLVPIMTCRMFGDKPQPGQIMTRSQLDFRIKFHSKLSLKRIHLKVVSAGGDYHDIGLNVLRHISTGDPLHNRAACTQPCNVNTHSRAHCSPGARLCEQWEHGCVNNGARLCASARLCRGSPVISHHFYEQGSCDVYLYRINHFSWVFNKTICIYLLSTIIVTDRIERLTKQSMPCVVYTLTLNVRGQSYLGLTRSISWLLMPWLLTSPGHQQLWYWLCRRSRFLSYLRKDFNYLRRINMEKWHQM